MNSKRHRKKEGFLQVKLSSRSALGKAWKRKWVVVQQNTSSTGKSLLLELYIEKGAYHKTVTSLLLEDVDSVRRTKSKTQEHAIEISTATKTLLAVSADSETETQEWLHMFKMNLLPPITELPSPPGIPQDFVRVAVVPNKYSDALNLEGDYFAHVSLASINLYDIYTGGLAQEWDLRHLRKFMLISKCHPLDVEKIVHILPSKRSPKGEGEFVFFGSRAKELVEDIYGRLSTAMTVKSRRSRSTSMLFEITPQELEQIMKESQQPPDETLQEADEEIKGGETREESIADQDAQANGVDAGNCLLVPDAQPEAKTGEDAVGGENNTATEEPDGPPIENITKSEKAGNRDVPDEDEKRNDDTSKTESSSDVKFEDVARQLGEANSSLQTQDANGNLIDERTEFIGAEQEESIGAEVSGEEVNAGQEVILEHDAEQEFKSDSKGQEDDKANQTNPDEMDACFEADTRAGLDSASSSEQTATTQVIAGLEQGGECTGDISVVLEQSEPDPHQEKTLNLLPQGTNQDVESHSENKYETAVEEDNNKNYDVGGNANVAVSSKIHVPVTLQDALEPSDRSPNEDKDVDLVTKDGITPVDLKKGQETDPARQASDDGGEQPEVNQPTEEVSLETFVHSSDVDHTETKADTNVQDPVASTDAKKTTDVNPVVKSDHEGSTGSATQTNSEPGDALSPNLNNSNANKSMAIPLPNALTSRMAEALKKSQKRSLSADMPANQETQTEFSPDSADQTEIIV